MSQTSQEAPESIFCLVAASWNIFLVNQPIIIAAFETYSFSLWWVTIGPTNQSGFILAVPVRKRNYSIYNRDLWISRTLKICNS